MWLSVNSACDQEVVDLNPRVGRIDFVAGPLSLISLAPGTG